ncbi:galactose oxidase [Ancylomarina salipaludis]|uniref:Galactose oxidase n=1 Tax=Ancylomarina salipaludis TaxID=2501299 RepID=A0A4Q1JPZ8_9BACT|nr:galactose oxidase [Ancylomarina salipaludis]RXQ96814.1 galactose oxidase [Ancylomarina salipaludis]
MTKIKLLLLIFIVLECVSCDNKNNTLQGNWIQAGSFEGEPRSGAVSFTIGDDAYIGTGYRKIRNYDETEDEHCLKSFYKYNLKNGWMKIADFPGKARHEAVAFSINGKGYVGTGVDIDGNRLKDFYEYDPETNTWKEAPEFIGGARQGAIAFSINNIGYVGTGYGVLDGEDENYLKNFFKFESGEWTDLGLYPGEKTAYSTSFVIDNKAYLVSGHGSLDDVWEFDPSVSSVKYECWSHKKDLDTYKQFDDMLRSNAVSFVIDKKGYLATGRIVPYQRTVWEYDSETDKWIEKTGLEMEIHSRENAVGFSINNRGFIATGNVGDYYLDDMWEFNPIMDKTNRDN